MSVRLRTLKTAAVVADRVTTSSEGGADVVVFVVRSTTRTDVQPVGPRCCYVLLEARRLDSYPEHRGRLEDRDDFHMLCYHRIISAVGVL